jgi:hypothetical protein
MGRPPRSIEEAREFGRLVELERKSTPGAKDEEIFYRIRRSDPKRWKSRATMYRFWADYKKDLKQNPVQAQFWRWVRDNRDKPSEAPKTRARRPDTGRLGLPYDDD